MTNYQEYLDERENRDKYLYITSVVEAATTRLQAYEDWILDEINAIIPQAEAVRATVSDLLKSEIDTEISELKQIRTNELVAAVQWVKNKQNELKDGVYPDIMEATHYLDDGFLRLERLADRLLRFRRLIDGFQS